MFKILVYAYSQNIYSSCGIEKACRRDINFRWLLAGYDALDHSNIDCFRQKYAGAAMEDLFYMDIAAVLLLLEKKCQEEKVEFVHGSGKRPKRLQKQYEKVKEYLERQKKYAKNGVSQFAK